MATVNPETAVLFDLDGVGKTYAMGEVDVEVLQWRDPGGPPG